MMCDYIKTSKKAELQIIYEKKACLKKVLSIF